MNIGFDLISDLNLTPEDKFDWEGKATSLYCVIAGNISNDLRTVRNTLIHLTKFYQGVFYVAGSLEYDGVDNIQHRTDELIKLTNSVRNVAFLHHNVVIVDGIALVGVNGWYGNTITTNLIDEIEVETHRHEDIVYLKSTLERLQRHLDVKKIFVVSNSSPGPELFFGEDPPHVHTQLPVNIALGVDTEKKVSHWAYGTYGKVVDITIKNINYLNNSCYKRSPYWAKRVEITA